MFEYSKALQYPVKIARPNARLAKAVMSQLGGHNTKKIHPAEHQIRALCRVCLHHIVFRIAALVFGPTIPSASIPCRCWNSNTALSVSVPNTPSTAPV